MRRRLGVVIASVGMMLGLVGITVATSQGHRSATSSPTYLVALGDSYAEGYQPGFPKGSETLHGFNNQVVTLVAPRHELTLVNFGCGGATSDSILHDLGCWSGALNAPSYPTSTQFAAALAFIGAHQGHIGLVTISLGFNDISNCIRQTNGVGCVAAAMPKMKTNLTSLVAKLRAVAGPKVPMIGTSYPDVMLAAWVAAPPAEDLARQSLTAFNQLINPNLAAGYATGNVSFVNVTKGTGAFIPLTSVTTLKPYGTIPVAVAKVCTLTWTCAVGDIHPNAAGYSAIAKIVAARYLQLAK